MRPPNPRITRRRFETKFCFQALYGRLGGLPSRERFDILTDIMHFAVDRNIWGIVMQISAAQCRAARSLLGWSQNQLGHNADVSRATIADFESNSRQPLKNNLRAIADCFFSAGVAFIPEDGNMGVGVRFRERRLECTRKVRIEWSSRRAVIRMRYSSQEINCYIPLEAINDYHNKNFRNDQDYISAVESIWPRIEATAEHFVDDKIHDSEMILTYTMLNSETD